LYALTNPIANAQRNRKLLGRNDLIHGEQSGAASMARYTPPMRNFGFTWLQASATQHNAEKRRSSES
jgi:hypothetical protein